ncbi:MAG: hypothetical protein Ct9H300mP14_11830 [Gammaproteobacteria bacterium]|nr:MAG: hypothetical protein Ct9H300mP14_11830 [Gammaproteobacteria bacterium]
MALTKLPVERNTGQTPLPQANSGLVLRSPHAHAQITRIDTSKAEKLNGVKAVITSKDLPDLTEVTAICTTRLRTAWRGNEHSMMATPSPL